MIPSLRSCGPRNCDARRTLTALCVVLRYSLAVIHKKRKSSSWITSSSSMSFRCPPYSSVSPSSTSEPIQARPSLPSPRRFTPLRVLPPPKPSRSYWSVVTPVSPPYPPISTQITREEWNAFDRRRKDPESERLQRQALVKAHSESQHAYPVSSLKRRLGHNASEQKRRESISKVA